MTVDDWLATIITGGCVLNRHMITNFELNMKGNGFTSEGENLINSIGVQCYGKVVSDIITSIHVLSCLL